MNGKIYLIEYTIIVLIMTIFNRSSPLTNLTISFLIIIIQFTFDKLRKKYK